MVREMRCPKCITNPDAHSFVNLGKTPNGVSIFYTCPAKAKDYRDEPKFLEYFEAHLSEAEGQPWIWIFDCQGFTQKHATSLSTGKGLIRLLEEKHKHMLQNIFIVHEAWHFHALLSVLMPFVKKEARKRMHQLTGSTLEIMVKLEKQGIPMNMLSCLREAPEKIERLRP